MNRTEAKNLLKRREELYELLQKIENDNSNNLFPVWLYNISRTNTTNTIINIDKRLSMFVKDSPVGEWLTRIHGITPSLAAGIMAYFNIKDKVCAAQFIKYAGTSSCKNPHSNTVKKLMDQIIYRFKSDPDSLYGRLNDNKFIDLLKEDPDLELETAHIRADRFMLKVFLSHLFEEMYREEHNGKLPDRYNDNTKIIIEPEVPYTK